MSRYVLFFASKMTAEWCGVGKVTIDTLPDYVLLQIFSFCQEDCSSESSRLLWWRPLVHVCRRWREIVFSSPRSLHLVIFCDSRTPTTTSLNIWPPFLISVHHHTEEECESTVAALKLRDRVSEICIDSPADSVLERLTAAMLEPFLELSYLHLINRGDTTPVLPDAFLGGFAPSLQNLALVNIAFSALPTLLLSTTRLTLLCLWSTEYISPEAMVTCLAALPNLEDLRFGFPSYPDHISSYSLTRTILPSLTCFHFHGVGEYSENLLARIDAPVLQTLLIRYFDVVFRVPQLYRFISCAKRFEPPSGVVVEFGCWEIDLKSIQSDDFELTIECDNLVGQVSSLAAICRELSRLLSRVERLDLHGNYLNLSPSWQGGTVPADLDWHSFFYPFISVQSLHVSKILGPFFAPALEELTKEGAETVLPKLRTLFLEGLPPSGPAREAMETFIATRSLSDHPVVFQQRMHLDSDTGAPISPSS